MDRRQFIYTAGVASTSALVGISGCIGPLGGDSGLSGGERAGYDSWVGSNSVEDGTVGAVTIDLELSRSLQDQETTTSTPTSTRGTDKKTDPLIGIPVTYLVGALLGLGFGLSDTGVSELIEAGGSAERAHYVADSIVLEGSFNTGSVSSLVSDSNGESVGSYQGYTLFRQDSGSTGTAIAVSDDSIVVVNGSDDIADPDARLRELLAVHEGEASRYSNESADYESLATAHPSRGVMGVSFNSNGGLLKSDDDGIDAGYGSSMGFEFVSFSDLTLDGDAVGGAISASIASDKVTSAIVLLYTGEEEVDTRVDIESALGSQADSRSVSIDGRTAYIEGTYEKLDITE